MYFSYHHLPKILLVSLTGNTLDADLRFNKSPKVTTEAETWIHPAVKAASILTETPSRASRVLGCRSHMTRVFVPVISASISVCVTEYHFLFSP